MVIKGLKNIKRHLDSEHQRNLDAWFKRNPLGPVMERAVRSEYSDRRRIRELEDEVHMLKERAMQEEASRQMYEAMGPDFDPNGFGTYP